MPSNLIVGERIRAMRAKLNLTQQELADLIGVKTSAVANYECGSRIPRDEIKKKIAKLAGTTVDEIFFLDQRHET